MAWLAVPKQAAEGGEFWKGIGVAGAATKAASLVPDSTIRLQISQKQQLWVVQLPRCQAEKFANGAITRRLFLLCIKRRVAPRMTTAQQAPSRSPASEPIIFIG